MKHYDSERMESATRDLVSQAIYREIKKGQGVDGAVYLDLTSIPSELFASRFRDLRNVFERHGVDLKTQWIKVSPAAHFFMGGCVIDTHCRTSVSGLFAAGEAAGGLHGANRLSGNGLSEALVFGRIAGKEAAAFRPARRKASLSFKSIDSAFPPGRKTVSHRRILEIQKRIKVLNWEKTGIVRDHTGLSEGIEELVSLKENLEQGYPESVKGLKGYLEVRSMLITSLAVALAAKVRKETRGAHFREDFPKTDPSMQKAVIVDLDGNEIRAEFS